MSTITNNITKCSDGISLRDKIAMQCLAQEFRDRVFADPILQQMLSLAKYCYQMADAMMEARGEKADG